MRTLWALFCVIAAALTCVAAACVPDTHGQPGPQHGTVAPAPPASRGGVTRWFTRSDPGDAAAPDLLLRDAARDSPGDSARD